MYSALAFWTKNFSNYFSSYSIYYEICIYFLCVGSGASAPRFYESNSRAFFPYFSLRSFAHEIFSFPAIVLKNSSNFWEFSRFIAEVLWLYLSRVNVAELWPRVSCRVLILPPLSTDSVAKVWRRSCIFEVGQPIFSVICRSAYRGNSLHGGPPFFWAKTRLLSI